MNPSAAPTPPAAPAPVNNDPSQFGQYSQWAQEQMAKGFTPDQLHAELANNGASAAPAHSGNFLTHILPTLGAVGGVLLAPETGGASLLATAALSGLGAAGGKALENATEGKQVFNGSDLTAGLEGAAGGAMGGVAGKIIGKGAEALGNTAAEKTAQAGAENAISDTATAYKDVPPQLQKLYNANDSLKHVGNVGFDATDPANLVKVANNSNDVLNSTLDRALANSGPIDLSNYPDLVKEALANEGGTLGSFEKVALGRGRLGYANTPASKLLQQLEDLGAGVAKTNSDPNEIRTLTSKLGALAQDAKPTVTQATGAIDPEQRATYNVINTIRDNLKDSLYNRPEVNGALKGAAANITAEDVGSQQLADHLNNVISTAAKTGDAQPLLSEISRNINIGNLGQEGQKAGQIVTSTGAQARAATDAGLNGAAPAGNGVLDAAHLLNPHVGMAKTAINAISHVKDNPAILSTLSRIGALGEKLAPAAGAAVGTAPELGAGPVGAAGAPVAGGATMGGVMNGNPTGEGAFNGSFNPNSLNSILSRYMYMGNVDPYLLSSTSPVVQALAPMAQKQTLASTDLAALNGLYGNAGGAQGTGGILSRISALIPGTAANQFQSERGATANAVGNAMGISPAAAGGLLPQLMNNPQTAGLAQSILAQLQGQLAY